MNDMTDKKDGRVISTRELFAQHSLRCTQQRMAVYETLRSSDAHPTAEELFRLVKPTTEKLSLATVYNTLDALCEASLVRRMPTTNGCCRYDADTTEHLHIRFRDTSQIRDVPQHLSERLLGRLPQDVLKQIEGELGVQINGISIQLVAKQGGDALPA